MSQPSAALLSIVIISLASQCASYEEAENLRTGILSIILVPFPAPSHMMGMATLGEKLVEQGHRVTFCVANIKTEYIKFGREIANRTGMNILSTPPSSKSNFSQSTNHLNWYMEKLKDIAEFTRRVSRVSKQIVAMLDGPHMRSWDIVIGEYLLWPVVGSLARKWSVPVIHFANALDYTPSNLPFWSYPLYGTGYTDDLTFLQRLHLILLFPVIKAITNSFESAALSGGGLADERAYTLPGTMTPFIVTTSFGFEYSRPVLPLVHYVGPIVENENTHKLLQGPLKSWLDSKSDASVVFISMGTTGGLSESEVTAITNGILVTQYNALWSIRDTQLHGLIRRLVSHQNEHRFFLSEWLPQQNVLRHSSIALAILHGGKGGVSQCLYNGVPGIIIPFALDRYDIAARVVSRGAGLRLNRHEITSKGVTEAITTVSSRQYKEAALKFRKIFLHDGGTEKAAELVEYYADVGYEHQIPAYAKYKWNWIQYYNMDVYALLFAVLALTIYGTFRMSKRMSTRWCKCFIRKKNYLHSNQSLKYAILLVILIMFVYMA